MKERVLILPVLLCPCSGLGQQQRAMPYPKTSRIKQDTVQSEQDTAGHCTVRAEQSSLLCTDTVSLAHPCTDSLPSRQCTDWHTSYTAQTCTQTHTHTLSLEPAPILSLSLHQPHTLCLSIINMHLPLLLTSFAALALLALAAPQPHTQQQVHTHKRRQLFLSDIQKLYQDAILAQLASTTTDASQTSATPASAHVALALSETSALPTQGPAVATHTTPERLDSAGLGAQGEAQTTTQQHDKLVTIFAVVSCVLLVILLSCIAALVLLYRRYTALMASTPNQQTGTHPAVLLPNKEEKDALMSYKAFWERKRRSAMSSVSEEARSKEAPAVARRGSSDSQASSSTAGPLPVYAVSEPVVIPDIQVHDERLAPSAPRY
ncbi:hypothetical protein BCR37DRAFT_174152 [Protomyces lactucae-debilis]|uniref:Uncharacterized protein n=1 Tax=Protomyces lactucae-debilis TaxID=2754530 RepID=A0A1Y2EUZ1_PROLT|nr:uncharacterized protein BCR37DRAFT_174152 [Protomyces lactucae-debilis]ORY75421.1 hypothetical protein BCR37DRAFT_174152 [Protomyces lactucae-debilis]